MKTLLKRAIPFCAALFLAPAAQALVIIEFSAVGDDASISELFKVPDVIRTATSFEISGSLIVDDSVAPRMEDLDIVLRDQIIGGSLFINGYSVGSFEQGYVRHAHESDEADPRGRHYQSGFSLAFAGNEEFDPLVYRLHTEDFGWSGPTLTDKDKTSVTAFFAAFKSNTYGETGIYSRSPSQQGRFEMYLDTDMPFVIRDLPAASVPEATSAGLLALGLLGMGTALRRKG